MPALLTTASTRPKASSAACTIAPPPSGVSTESYDATAWPPPPRMSSTTWSATLVSTPSPPMVLPTSLTTTRAPRRASSSTYRRPRPRPAPVTIATCPSKPTMLCFLALVANRRYRFRERGTTVRFSVVRSLEQLEPELDPLRLLASAFAGRTVEVAATDSGERSWTDGSTLFVDAGASHADQVRMLGVQASLLAAGSLAPDVVRQLSRRPALARRYLAIEAHRALAANDDLLPAVVPAP